MKIRHVNKSSSLCQLCHFILINHRQSGLKGLSQRHFTLSRSSSRQQRSGKVLVKAPVSTVKTERKASIKPSKLTRTDRDDAGKTSCKVVTQVVDNQAQLEELFRKAEEKYNHVISSENLPPTEQDILMLLKTYDLLALNLMQHVAPKVLESQKKTSASNALLSLDQQTARIETETVQATHPFVLETIEKLSKYAFALMTHPSTYITPDMLTAYVNLQIKLGKPETFPDVFHMYAHKPIPIPGSSPIQYAEAKPNKLANAISKETVDLALNSAIQARRLGIAINIIQTTFATKAYRRRKMVQKCFLPATAIALSPIALYVLATQYAESQTMMDKDAATTMAFAGMASYVGFTAFVGFLAVSTANDQMDRVTWVPGTPLRRRWLQEDERAAFDRIACAWGFKDRSRRGEEEGEEWEMLRECVGMKSMIVDQTSLLDGMQ